MKLGDSIHSKKDLSVFIGSIFLVSMLVYQTFRNAPLVDLRVYVEAAKVIVRGENPYQSPFSIPFGNAVMELHYLYPPLLAVTLSWITRLSFSVISCTWLFTSVFFLGFGAALLTISEEQSVRWRRATFLFFGLACAPPTLEGFYFGQVHTFIFALVCLAFATISSERWGLACLAVNLATAIKASPAILALAFIRTSTPGGVFYLALTAAVLALISSFSPRSLDVWADFYAGAQSVMSGARWWDNQENYSPIRVFAFGLGISSPKTVRICGSLLSGAAVVALVLLPKGTKDSLLRRRYISIAICLMTLLSPILWFHHLLWITPAILTAYKVESKSAKCILVLATITLCLSLYLDVYINHIILHDSESLKPILGPCLVLGPVAYIVGVLVFGKFREPSDGSLLSK